MVAAAHESGDAGGRAGSWATDGIQLIGELAKLRKWAKWAKCANVAKARKGDDAWRPAFGVPPAGDGALYVEQIAVGAND